MESESGISFTEFTYQLLQGYDFVHLARNHGVRMQVSTLRSKTRLAAAALHIVHRHVDWPEQCRGSCNYMKCLPETEGPLMPKTACRMLEA
jgi:hypothetical protein